ncbi:MAG: hypothetical protein WC761_05395 [Candidatus Paceibacterota bacterium]|jgi:hypothetical protein
MEFSAKPTPYETEKILEAAMDTLDKELLEVKFDIESIDSAIEIVGKEKELDSKITKKIEEKKNVLEKTKQEILRKKEIIEHDLRTMRGDISG